MSKLKVYKAKELLWSSKAIPHIISHGWSVKWNKDNKEFVGETGNRVSYAEFEYGYLRFRKRALKVYKCGWRCLSYEVFGEDYASM